MVMECECLGIFSHKQILVLLCECLSEPVSLKTRNDVLILRKGVKVAGFFVFFFTFCTLSFSFITLYYPEDRIQ